MGNMVVSFLLNGAHLPYEHSDYMCEIVLLPLYRLTYEPAGSEYISILSNALFLIENDEIGVITIQKNNK